MGLEAGDYIADLVQTNPTGTDQKLQGDDHLRLIKKVLVQSFPNVDAEVSGTPDQLNALTAIFPLTDDYFIRANGTAALELRSPAQVLNDIGADNASNLASGTVADARLSANVPLLDAANTFTGANVFGAGSEATPLVRFPGDGDTGLYQVSTGNIMGISLGGENQIRFDGGGQPIRIAGTDAASSVRYAIFTADQATERGYWGFPTSGNDQMILRNVVGTELLVRLAANASRLRIDDTTGVMVNHVNQVVADLEVGFRNIPTNSQNGSYTAVAGDAGGMLVKTSGGGGETYTIPSNASVPYPVGTVLTFVNRGGGNLTIAITSDTLVLAGVGTTGSRTLADNGLATALKIASTVWMISGMGLS